MAYEYKKHEYDPYAKSDDLIALEGKKTGAESTLDTVIKNGYTFSKQNDYDTMNANYTNWLNNGFTYDFNADALYQQYKDKYIQQGKMAMQDTMGQAAALTGGYGNSYASTVGNQAYQASLQNLNDVIPELYQMAYAMHNQKGQNTLNALGLLEGERNFEYGVWADKVNQLNADRNYYSTEANNLFNREYGMWNDNRTYDQTEHHNSENMLYQAARDAVADAQFDRQMQLEENKFKYTTGEYQPVDANGTPIVNNSGGGSVVEDGGGGDVPTSGITDAIKKRAESFTDNKSLEAYAESLEASGALSHEEALQLVADHMDYNEKYTKDENGNDVISYTDMIKSTKGWGVDYKGGGNLFGIDANARVVTPNGEIIRLDKLRDKLTDEGMPKAKATEYIKQLQQALKISSNWFAGL